MAHKIECDRCNGQGYIRGYSHVKDGICFKCQGEGKVNAPRQRKISTADAARRAEREAESQRRADQINAEIEAAQHHPYINYDEKVMRNIDHPNIRSIRYWQWQYHEMHGWEDCIAAKAAAEA